VITVTPSTITLPDTLGAADRPAQTVSVNAPSGTAPLTGLAVGTIGYGGGSTGWLTATLSGTDAPSTVTLKASKRGLFPGTYTAIVPITSGVATNSPQRVEFTLQVAPAPPPAPPPGPTVTIVAAGNLGKCGGSDFAKESARVIAAAKPDYVFVLGGNIHGPAQGKLTTLQDYMTCYDPTWGQFKSITYAALGDHEVDIDTIPPEYGSGMAPGADAYFGPSRIGPSGKNWYSFDLGSWHIIALNVQSPGGYTRPLAIRYHAGSDQLNWLYDDLDAHSKKCTLAFWYESMWISSTKIEKTSDRYPNHGYRVQDVRGIWTALYEKNADLVINGWPYIYERFAPMRYAEGYQHPTTSEYAADPARGIRQITNGLAGDGPLTVDSAVVRHPLSEYRSGGNGFLKLVLGNGAYTWEFLNTRYSHITDSGTGTCH
jgi:hypothetical protein